MNLFWTIEAHRLLLIAIIILLMILSLLLSGVIVPVDLLEAIRTASS